MAQATIRLPLPGGALEEYPLHFQEPLCVPPGSSFKSRVAYAAAHVVADPLATSDPINCSVIDMDGTLAHRRYLWSLGFGVAEAMDTAQRGAGLRWDLARDLIRYSCADARAVGSQIACGANTDQLDPGEAQTIDAVAAGYQEQCEFIEDCGGKVILMASRSLARCATSPGDYLSVYGRILSQVSQPVILHWLGEAFDPVLRDYWGGSTIAGSMEICLELIGRYAKAVDGIKLSLLDKDREIEMRNRLPPGVRMYTGDDFNYAELMEGDAAGHSHALLGVFDGIAPAAALALQQLDAGNVVAYRRLIEPTLPLARHIFEPPTYYYKTGLVFLSYLNGRQKHFRMLGGQESARSVVHLASVFRHAAEARLLSDPPLAVCRLRHVLALAGIC